MSLRLYFFRASLQAWDPFFGNPKQIYVRSALINDNFPAKVLLEVERRYMNIFAKEGVDKLSILATTELDGCGQSNLRAKHFFDPADHVECLFTSCGEFGLREYVLSVECGDMPYISSIQESSYSLLYMVFLWSDISMTLKQPVTMPAAPSPLLTNVGPLPATINKHSLHLWHSDLKWKEACKTQLDSHQMGPKAPFFTITPVQDLIYSSSPSRGPSSFSVPRPRASTCADHDALCQQPYCAQSVLLSTVCCFLTPLN
ncbi:hypothetical protein EDD18DRAFT_1103387 [Armillaria luteobubalina]|uniref:Uncharacterized protein n=1 Tax=Armillaria luteobubalina TaxID=153913 RepID=A0AA39Q9S9_9AGAR|nr:hypothetical protein EDD18DRAFT_1103387 [Armillaria luteobubalina]